MCNKVECLVRVTTRGVLLRPLDEKCGLRSNVFKVFGNDGVFLMAWIVTTFNMMAV